MGTPMSFCCLILRDPWLYHYPTLLSSVSSGPANVTTSINKPPLFLKAPLVMTSTLLGLFPYLFVRCMNPWFSKVPLVRIWISFSLANDQRPLLKRVPLTVISDLPIILTSFSVPICIFSIVKGSEQVYWVYLVNPSWNGWIARRFSIHLWAWEADKKNAKAIQKVWSSIVQKNFTLL